MMPGKINENFPTKNLSQTLKNEGRFCQVGLRKTGLPDSNTRGITSVNIVQLIEIGGKTVVFHYLGKFEILTQFEIWM